MDPAGRVRDLIEPALGGAGFELVDVEVSSRLLRVTVDRPAGLDLDAVSTASQLVSELLDAHDPVPGDRYTLEVSSPGLERRLRTPDHFRRFVGSTVAVRATAAVSGARRIQGQLAEADDDGIVVKGPDGERRFAYADIDRAHTVFEWGQPSKPTKPSKASKAPKSSPRHGNDIRSGPSSVPSPSNKKATTP